MSKLIRNELIKIFHKKSIYVMGIIILIFSLINNILIKTQYDDEGNLKNNSINYNYYNNKEYLLDELNGLDFNNSNDVELYVTYKTDYDVALLSEKYTVGSWQYNLLYEQLHGIINDINYYTYIEKDSELLKKYQDKYDLYLNRFENDDWQSFVNEDIDELNKELELAEKNFKATTNKTAIASITNSIKNYEEKLKLLNYRISRNISYANSYLNTALNEYSTSLSMLREYEAYENRIEELDYEQKQNYYNNLKNYNLNKYIIESGNNIYQANTLRMGIKNLFDNYQLFLIILILIIAGSIVSEEYNKGTIKLLLVKPYKRSTILLSKYLTILIILLLAIMYTFIIEFLIGGFLLGFDSLNIPVVAFNINTMAIESLNVINYFVIYTLSKLPVFLILITLAFTLSTITGNTVISIMLAILGYMFGDFINTIALAFNLKWMRYFITPNWDLSNYLFGGLSPFMNVKLPFSIVICIIYFLIMMVVAFIMFKRKNIKNQ